MSPGPAGHWLETLGLAVDNCASGIVLAKTGMLLIGPILIEYPAIILRKVLGVAAVQLRLGLGIWPSLMDREKKTKQTIYSFSVESIYST